MHHAIEFLTGHAAALSFGKRLRLPQGRLLQVRHGMGLLRLGNREQLLCDGECFWLPADCLAAFTPLRGCQWREARFSVRQPQPSLSGWLHPSPLLEALLDDLTQWQEEREWQGPYGDRLRVLSDLLLRHPLHPEPTPTTLQQEWQGLNQGLIPAEVSEDLAALVAQYRLIRADRQLKGGQAIAPVLAALGYPDELSWQQELACWLQE
ncbi:hypothetical protein [Aeromonas schubertii]|uniref:AraC family transcriptional regulator n=1 Tax=Aeromonas schubertii TaxID=652 RepID=A0ABS7VEF3_9GAMM|nr:hypothetical protein [Aeromonas schubertii]MBZ6067333.1 hypothetical protein [Aeromonas schubertii]MBZ6070804.1 hypothetical protein [Aeromonas schubertii]